jgi:hypothetical protein
MLSVAPSTEHEIIAFAPLKKNSYSHLYITKWNNVEDAEFKKQRAWDTTHKPIRPRSSLKPPRGIRSLFESQVVEE